MSLCKYKDALGVPGKGVHSIRFMGVAIVDVVSTLVGGYLISKVFGTNITYTIIALFLLGIYLHWLFCVNTTIGKLLGLTR
jgi:hypothetical protein